MKKNYSKLLFIFCCLGIASGLFGQVIITELADPNDEFACRYVELHNPSTMPVDLSLGWTLRLYSNANTTFATTTLTGTIPAGGYYIICSNNTATGFAMCFPTATCDQSGSVNSNGDDNYELVDPSGTVVDSYGIPGVDGTGTASEFEDGRAERATGVCAGSTPFNAADWNICSDAPGSCGPINIGDGIYDPGVWAFEASCTPPPPPMPSCFFTEDFEDAMVSYTLSQAECNDMGGDYFTRTDGTNVGGTYNNPIGTTFFAAQDIDGSPCMMPMSTMFYNDLAIANFTNIELCVYLAEDQASNGAEDWDATDFLHINYDVDNSGTTTPAIWVEADPTTLSATGFNGLPRIDTDFDGDGDGAEITDDFTQYCFTIPTTGSVIDIEIVFAVNAGDEDIAIDELTLCGIFVAPTDPTISQTDIDGDGIPDITDPCACDDPQNISNMGVVYFHDFVTIVSDPGETWTLTNLLGGTMYAMDLTTTFGVGTVIPEVSPGVYHLEFWTESTVGFSAEFNRSVMPLAAPLAAGGTCDASTCCDLTGNIASTVPTCVGNADGTISFTDINCTTCTAVEYSIDNVNFQTSPTFTGLTSGTYQVFARDTDNFQCELGMANFMLADPSPSAPTIICPPADETVECTAIPAVPTVNAVDLGNTGLPVWINEFHYDNTGADQGEFIEVAGLACTNLFGYTLELYNGANGTLYNNTIIGGMIPDEGNGFGAISFPIAGIQNGAPDGIALVQGGTVVQFLSYEGTFTATNGSAAGMTSTDVGVFQPGTNPVMLSLQLMGTGTTYDDFTWSNPSAETPGTINNGQTLQSNVTVTFSENIIAGGCSGTSSIERTWSATSACGLTATHTQTITVEDTGAPTAMCQDITVQLDEDGNATITPAQIDNGSSDLCGTISLSLDNTDFSCQNIGANNTVTLTVTDGCGNSSTCTATVTVEDNVPPVITCPSDQTFHLDPGACDYRYSYEVTATDNCEFMLTTTFLSTTLADNNGFAGNMFDIEAVGASAIGINSFDMNLDVQGASVDVSVWYTTSANTYVGNETNAGAWTLLGSATVTSNGAGMATTVPIGGLTLAAGDAKGIYVATTNGNFMQYTNGNGANQNYSDANLSIETGIGRGVPVFTGPIFNPRVWNGNIHYSFLAPAAPLVTLSAGLPSGSAFPIGTTTQTHVATDGQGNTSTCSFDVTVVEFVPSSFEITCNNLVHISLDENCQSVVGADQILEGNNYGCYDNYPVTFADGPNQGQAVVLDGSHIGQTINVMVTNPQGNPCWGQILVEDKLIPDLVCTDVSVRCDEPTTPGASIAATLDYSFPTVTSIDNATVTETVAVGAGDEVVDLDVTISTNHTWIGDVDMTITSPSGTVVTLFDRPGVPATPFGCNNTVDMNFSFDDDAVKTATDMENDCPPDGAYQPIDPLATFNGEPAQGTWTVTIMDSAAPDAGDFDITLNLKATNSGTVAFPVPASATVTPAGNNTFTVIGFDPCGPATLSYTDVGSGDACAGTQIITRDWSVVDGYGNTSSCTQTISITPTTLADVANELPADITLECGATLPAPITSIGTCDNIGIALAGAPNIIEICGSGFKMLRKYVVVDWCTNETMEHTQLIKVEDTTDPVITCPADLTVSTSSNSCNGNVALVMPTWTDCGGGVTFTMTASAGTISGNLLVGLPVGTHDVTFTGTDACGNSSTCTQKITVEDNVSPTAVCDEHTIVALGSDGTALVNATTFDDGSNDNCGIVSMEAQRMDNPSCPGFDGTSFGATVPFYCCDIGSTVMVAFRVTDAAGNTNTCMVEVDVQDKMNPTIVCKPDLTISCDDPIIADIQVGQPLPASAVALVGTPAVTDNCNATISSNVISSTLDNCGMGEIKIAWSAVDGAGNFDGCFQSIFINDANPFNGNSIVWPQDYEANTCGLGLEPEDLPTANGFPTWDDGTCSNIASTHEDTQLGFGADNACLTILRKWIIIDWCAVPAGADPTDPNTTGVWHYTQVIKVLNSTAPVIESFNGATTIDNFDENCGGVFVAFDITASDDCTPANLLSYAWEFSTGTSGQGTAASATFVNGTYSVTFTVSDQCGNSSTDSRTFTVADKKKPTPVCIFGIASTVMPSAQQVTIWASDFESGSSYDNCTDYNNLIFSFSPVVPGQPIDDNLVITCADVPSDGLVPVTLYVTDAAGNFDFCTTFINVQDPNGACPGPNTIFGAVQTEDEEMVEDVIVTVEDNNGPMTSIIPVVTGVNGTFSFNTNGMSNATYDVIAEKDVNYLNGVTTYDLVLISKHILGIEILDSPYKIIAADANHSETITGLDVVKLRALILHIDDELSNNDSWRFVDANYTFNNPANPFGENFPEFVEAVPNSAVPSNFTGIKIGDVNATASPNSLLGTEARTMDGQLAIQAKAMTVAQGETFTIDFTAKDFNNIAGYQFTLGFDNSVVEFVDLTSNLEGLNANNFGLTKTGEGVITTSWNSNRGVSVENNEVLFSVTFVANADVNTQDVFTINSRLTASEAYQGDDLLEVVLAFNGTRTANGFELYQNTPNPFKAETMIGFNLPEAGEVTLKIFDVSGRILRLIEMDAAKGYNSVDVNRAGIDATGVLYYQLETATETATKKMIIVD